MKGNNSPKILKGKYSCKKKIKFEVQQCLVEQGMGGKIFNAYSQTNH